MFPWSRAFVAIKTGFRASPGMTVHSGLFNHRQKARPRNDKASFWLVLEKTNEPGRRESLASGRGVALAEGLEEDHAGGHGNVERFDGPDGGKRHDEVAAFARQFVEALAFAAKHDSYRRSVVHLGIGLVRAFVQPHQPVAD